MSTAKKPGHKLKHACSPDCTYSEAWRHHAAHCANYGARSGKSVPYAERVSDGNRAMRVAPELHEQLEAVRLLGLVPEAIEALKGLVEKSTNPPKAAAWVYLNAHDAPTTTPTLCEALSFGWCHVEIEPGLIAPGETGPTAWLVGAGRIRLCGGIDTTKVKASALRCVADLATELRGRAEATLALPNKSTRTPK